MESALSRAMSTSRIDVSRSLEDRLGLYSMNRESEIAQNLASVEAQIGDAVVAAGRKRSEITLVVVTKNFPVSDMKILYRAGYS